MSARRRALMAGRPDGWEDTGFRLSSDTFVVSGNLVALFNSDGSMLLYNTVAGTYRGGNATFTGEAGYEYLVDFDIEIYRGVGHADFGSSSQLFAPGSGSLNTSGHVQYVYSNQANVQNITRISLCCTWSVSQIGNIIYRNFKIYKRRYQS